MLEVIGQLERLPGSLFVCCYFASIALISPCFSFSISSRQSTCPLRLA